MDAKNEPIQLTAHLTGAPSWITDGQQHWRPLMCEVVIQKQGASQLAVVAPEGTRILYPKVDAKRLAHHAPFFIRFVSKGVYEISTLMDGPHPTEVRFLAYRDPAHLTASAPPSPKYLSKAKKHYSVAGPSKPQQPTEKKPKVRPASAPISYVGTRVHVQGPAVASAKTLHLPDSRRAVRGEPNADSAVQNTGRNPQQNHRQDVKDKGPGIHESAMALAFKRARNV